MTEEKKGLATKLEEVSPIKKKIEVSIPVDRVRETLEEEYKKIGKSAKVKGFRKGKVPRPILEQYYSAEAIKGTAEQLVRGSYPEALEQESAVPVSAPYVEAGPFDKDKPFTYSATFEIRPVVELGEFADLKLEKPEIVVTADEVDHQLEMIRQQMTQLEPLPDDTRSAKGMVLVIDFKGKADGEGFKGSEAKDFLVELGAGSLLPQLEDALSGMAKGEEKDFEMTYPADYFNKELAGKKASFHVKVKEVKRKIVPELSDEFAKDLGKFSSLNEVKKDIERRILELKEQNARRILSGQVLEQLVLNHPFEVPEAMTSAELKMMFESFVRHLVEQGKKFDDTGMTIEQFVERYKNDAENRVRGFLIIDAIADMEGVSVSEEEIESRIRLVAQQVNQPFPKVRQQYEAKNLIGGLRVQIRHEKAIDLVIDRAKIKVIKPKKEEKGSK